MWRQVRQGRLFKRSQANVTEADFFPLIETKELRKVAASDRSAVAKHEDLAAFVMQLELIGLQAE